jgi:hypothetical protein
MLNDSISWSKHITKIRICTFPTNADRIAIAALARYQSLHLEREQSVRLPSAKCVHVEAKHLCPPHIPLLSDDGDKGFLQQSVDDSSLRIHWQGLTSPLSSLPETAHTVD